MPTGAGKTTIFDGIISHSIPEDPGGILLSLQTDPDAKEYVEERLMPILRGVPSVAALMESMDRHAIRKDAVMFPHMPLYMGGANLTNAQRRSVRYVLLDEVWRYKHGLVREFRARTHDRWNARVVLVSQGGTTHIMSDAGMVETELEHAWLRTDRREWCFACPECGEVQRFRLKGLHYDSEEKQDGSIDELAILQSARYQCQGRCQSVFQDTIQNRRALADAGRYVIQNPAHLPRHHGWHCNALTLYYLPWGQLAIEHAEAMRARKAHDDSPITKLRQKRMAENVRQEDELPATAMTVGDYSIADYLNGETWPGEAVRVMTIDVQRDHFWSVLRAWKSDGSSRLLWAGRVNTWEALREMQERYKVQDRWTFCDSQHDTDEVYNRCGRYNSAPSNLTNWQQRTRHGWHALQGDQADQYRFNPPNGKPYYKFYSPLRYPRGSAGVPCASLLWSTRQIKRILEKLRGGYRQSYEIPRDIDSTAGKARDAYTLQMFSETEKDVISKTTKMVSRTFVRIGDRQNHLWDCECMQVVAAMMAGILSDVPEVPAVEQKAA